jgi:hypothetical protein
MARTRASSPIARLGVPDRQLPVEVAEGGKGHQVDAVPRGGGAHRQKGFDHLAVQCTRRILKLDDVGATAARKFVIRKTK